jgi:hypothetical protein
MLQNTIARPFPLFPMSGPETGHEGRLIHSMPGHRMVYNGDLGMAGVEIETPDGMLISFGSKTALERFVQENQLTAEDCTALRAIDARADRLRSPDTWVPSMPSTDSRRPS